MNKPGGFRKDLLWSVLQDAIANGEAHYHPQEQPAYFYHLGITLGTLLDHYAGKRRSGESQNRHYNPFSALRGFFDEMGGHVLFAFKQRSQIFAQLYTPSLRALFRDDHNCRIFHTALVGSLVAQRLQFCTVQIYQDQRAKTYILAICCREGSHEGHAFEFRKDELPYVKPDSCQLLMNTVHSLLKKQGFQMPVDLALKDSHKALLHHYSVILQLAVENDRLLGESRAHADERKELQETVSQREQKLRNYEQEQISLEEEINRFREEARTREGRLLSRITELESSMMKNRKELEHKSSILEKVLAELRDVKQRKKQLELRQEGFDALLSVISAQKGTIDRMEKTLKEKESRGDRPLTASGSAQSDKNPASMVPHREPGESLDEYHYYLMDTCERLSEENILLSHSVFVDKVTGFFNSKYLMRRLEEEVNRVRRHRRNLSFIKIEIKNLSRLIGEEGQSGGSQALLSITASMRKSLRNIDIITRTGDDEFVILLPETALDDALSVAQRISKNLRNLSLKGTAGTNIRISVSGTVLCFDDYESPDTDVVKVAGQILLHGKKVNIGTLKLREVHYAAVCNN